jgi:hypothetical protein
MAVTIQQPTTGSDATFTTSGTAVALDVNLMAGSVSIIASDIEIGAVELKNSDTDDRASIDTNGNLAIRNFSTLVPEEYDYIDLTYTGDDLTTVTYKTGGSGGTTVATLTLTYTASVLQTVTRT